MDIACPNCNAAYRVPDALLLQRKPLRCAACGHAWVPELPTEAPPLPVAPILAAAAVQAPPPSPEPAAPGAFVNPPGAPRPDALQEAAPEAAEPRPVRGPATPPPLAERKWPSPRRADDGPEEEEEDEAQALRPRRARRKLSGVLLLLAWVMSVAVIGGTLTLLFLFRADVAEAWSPFLRVVQVIGG